MTGQERRISTRTWLVVAAVAVVLTGWPGVVAVLVAIGYVAYRGRPRDLVLLAAAGVGLTALAVVLGGLPSRATLSPEFVADNWLANALAAISLVLATVGVVSDLSMQDEPAVEPAPLPPRRWTRPRARVVTACAAVALALGAGFAAVYVAGDDSTAPELEQQIADRLLAGDGFELRDEAGVDRPTAARMPVVPATLAVLAAGNVNQSSQQVLWALVGVATAVVSAATAAMLFGRRSAVVTGLLVLLLPVFVIDSARRDSTALAALALVGLTAVLARATTSRSRAWLVGGGGLGGLLALTRPEGVLIALAVLCAWLWIRPRSESDRLVPVLVLCGLLVLLGPWLLRNHDQTATWWPTTSVGAVIAGSNAPSTYRVGDFLGSFDAAAASEAASNLRPETSSEAAVSSSLLRRGSKHATGHPVFAARAAGARVLRAFELWDGRAEQRVQRARGVDVRAWGWRQASFLVLLAIGALGVVRMAGRRDITPVLPMLAAIAAVAVVALLTYGDPVLRSVVDPLIAILAGATFARAPATASDPSHP